VGVSKLLNHYDKLDNHSFIIQHIQQLQFLLHYWEKVMYYRGDRFSFIYLDVKYELSWCNVRCEKPGRSNYFLTILSSNKDNDKIQIRSLKQLAKKYLKCDIEWENFTPVIRIGYIYQIEIDVGTTQEMRATFLAALAIKARYI